MSKIMHPRLAPNLSKLGFYPTDLETLQCLRDILKIEAGAKALDPCCGEGVALNNAIASDVQRFGVELDEERARISKENGIRVLQGDFFDAKVGHGMFDFLLLNPPYGDLSVPENGVKRLEHKFYRKAMLSLRIGGVVVLIVPVASLNNDREKGLIARHLSEVYIYKTMDQQFNQLVLIGRKAKQNFPNRDVLAVLKKAVENPEKVPSINEYQDVSVGVDSGKDLSKEIFHLVNVNPDVLKDSVKDAGHWQCMTALFSVQAQPIKPSAMPLGDWHIALALAAGQLNGILETNDRRRFFIKGATEKQYSTSETIDEREESTVHKVITKESFVAVIKGIDLTEGSTNYGETFIIQ